MSENSTSDLLLATDTASISLSAHASSHFKWLEACAKCDMLLAVRGIMDDPRLCWDSTLVVWATVVP